MIPVVTLFVIGAEAVGTADLAVGSFIGIIALPLLFCSERLMTITLSIFA